ncbi:MAG: YncE family protein [Methylococcaceae bacterium]|nr:YncE family protein [Methylococcaceae bacterium]
MTFRMIAALWLILVAADSALAAKGRPHEPGATSSQRVEEKGVAVEFSLNPANGAGELMEGDFADLGFRITDAQTRQPIRGRAPGVWLDTVKSLSQKEGDSCKDKIETFLKGMAGVRPMLDLNSYYLMVFNQDASISVVDPLVGVSGRTNLFATIILNRPPADWIQSRDGKRLFVSMPEAGQVAVVDTENFKVIDNVAAGAKPRRLGLQPDGHYLWVGNETGVTAIDTETLKATAHIETGKGHHELAFTADDSRVFASNRDDGTVSVIDVRGLKKLADLKTGPLPIALAYSATARALYVADGVDGSIAVVSGEQPKITAAIAAKPGLGPMKPTPNGRWLLALNSKESKVHVIETATNRLVQDIPVGGRPYEIAFSADFAYVRSLDSEHVGMIALSRLGQDTALQTSTFTAGTAPPRQVADLGLGTSMAAAVGEAAMLVASPADNLVYYYMEGMLAPSGNFRNPAHSARGIAVVNRSLKESRPGQYSARVKIPAAGDYDVAFLLESPRIIHCFHATAAVNPKLAEATRPLEITYLTQQRRAAVGQTLTLKFRLDDPKAHAPKTGLTDVKVLYYLAPGLMRTELPARALGDGQYEADLAIKRAGAYYAYVGVASEKLRFGDLPVFSLIAAEPAKPAPQAK